MKDELARYFKMCLCIAQEAALSSLLNIQKCVGFWGYMWIQRKRKQGYSREILSKHTLVLKEQNPVAIGVEQLCSSKELDERQQPTPSFKQVCAPRVRHEHRRQDTRMQRLQSADTLSPVNWPPSALAQRFSTLGSTEFPTWGYEEPARRTRPQTRSVPEGRRQSRPRERSIQRHWELWIFKEENSSGWCWAYLRLLSSSVYIRLSLGRK